MILMVLARTLAWIAEDLGPTWLRALANLTNALFGANEAFPQLRYTRLRIISCLSCRIDLIGNYVDFCFATATVGLCHWSFI